MGNTTEMIMYQTEDGQTKIDVRMENQTVWLSLNQLAELFQRDKSVISKHIKNVFDEGELQENSTVAKFATVQDEGSRTVSRDIVYYNLDVSISVGYRVKSLRGTQFRIWATKRLNEYIIKGFTMNDDLLKKAGGGNYFEELLDRIRDIRSSEKVFWRKVLDIYATSIDYHPNTADTKQFSGEFVLTWMTATCNNKKKIAKPLVQDGLRWKRSSFYCLIICESDRQLMSSILLWR